METSLRGKLVIVLLTLGAWATGSIMLGGWIESQAQDPRQQRRINADRNRQRDILDRQAQDDPNRKDDRPLKVRLDSAWLKAAKVLERLEAQDRQDVILWANLRSNWAVEMNKNRSAVARSRPEPPGPKAKSTPKDHLDNAKKLMEDPTVPREMVQRRLREVAERFPNTSEADGARKLLKELEGGMR